MESPTRTSSSESITEHSNLSASPSFRIQQDSETSSQRDVKPLDDENEDEDARQRRMLLLDDDDDDDENVVDFFAESVVASKDELKIASEGSSPEISENAILAESVNVVIDGTGSPEETERNVQKEDEGLLTGDTMAEVNKVAATSSPRLTELPAKPRTAPSPAEHRRDILRTPNTSRYVLPPSRFPRGPSPVPKDPIPKFHARPVPSSQPPLEPTRSFSPKLHNLLKSNQEWMQRGQEAEGRCKNLEIENRTLKNILIRLADTENCRDQVLSLLWEHGVVVDVTSQEAVTEQASADPPLKSALRDLAQYISMKKNYALGSRKAGKYLLSQAIARAMTEDPSRSHPVSPYPHSTFSPHLNQVLATLPQQPPLLEPEICRIRGPETANEVETTPQESHANEELRPIECQPDDKHKHSLQEGEGSKTEDSPDEKTVQLDNLDDANPPTELKQDIDKSNDNPAKAEIGTNKTHKSRPRTPAAVKTALFKTIQDPKIYNRRSWHDRPKAVRELNNVRGRGKVNSSSIHRTIPSASLSFGHLDAGIKFPVGGNKFGHVHRTTNASGDAADVNSSVIASLQRQLEIHAQALQECISALVEEQQEKTKLQRWISQSRKQNVRPLPRTELEKRTNGHPHNDTGLAYESYIPSVVTSCLTVPVDGPSKRPATSPAFVIGGQLSAFADVDSLQKKQFAYKCPEIQMLAPFAKRASIVAKKGDSGKNVQIIPALDEKYTNTVSDYENVTMPRNRRVGWKNKVASVRDI